MAASLVRSMSKLCLHAQRTPLPASTPCMAMLNSPRQFSTTQQNCASLLRHTESLFSMGSLRTIERPLQVQTCSFHTTPVCSTTVELKQWRKHRVIDRFYRLHWGAWIRTRGGRHRGLYRKTSIQRWRLKQHIFCNAKQSKLLDILATAEWKEPKYFVDTPYEPYHKRTNSFHFPNHRKFYP